MLLPKLDKDGFAQLQEEYHLSSETVKFLVALREQAGSLFNTLTDIINSGADANMMFFFIGKDHEMGVLDPSMSGNPDKDDIIEAIPKMVEQMPFKVMAIVHCAEAWMIGGTEIKDEDIALANKIGVRNHPKARDGAFQHITLNINGDGWMLMRMAEVEIDGKKKTVQNDSEKWALSRYTDGVGGRMEIDPSILPELQ